MDQKAVIDCHIYYKIPFIVNKWSYLAVNVCIIDLIRTFLSYLISFKKCVFIRKIEVAIFLFLLTLVNYDFILNLY